MDIEGEEFSFFLNSWNFDFIINNVKKIASEFHLSYLREVSTSRHYRKFTVITVITVHIQQPLL